MPSILSEFLLQILLELLQPVIEIFVSHFLSFTKLLLIIVILLHADTTDVQVITAVLFDDENSTTIQCEFLLGSNAVGCMVVLTSENNQKEYYNLTRNPDMNCSNLVVNLEHPHYQGVEGLILILNLMVQLVL